MYLGHIFFNGMHFWIFCLISPSVYDKVLSTYIYTYFSKDMHFSDILSDFSLD